MDDFGLGGFLIGLRGVKRSAGTARIQTLGSSSTRGGNKAAGGRGFIRSSLNHWIGIIRRVLPYTAKLNLTAPFIESPSLGETWPSKCLGQRMSCMMEFNLPNSTPGH